MSEVLENIPDALQPDDVAVKIEEPKLTVLDVEGIGEIMVGHADVQATLMLAAVAQNNPTINQILLASNLKFTDRTTGTKIFPREGMPLPNGEIYATKTED